MESICLEDRELLEACARVARMAEIEGWSFNSMQGMRLVDSGSREFIRYWNPLTVDQDTVQLARDCGMLAELANLQINDKASTKVWATAGPPYSAETRRRLVRRVANRR
jgi:hypothetical protein